MSGLFSDEEKAEVINAECFAIKRAIRDCSHMENPSHYVCDGCDAKTRRLCSEFGKTGII